MAHDRTRDYEAECGAAIDAACHYHEDTLRGGSRMPDAEQKYLELFDSLEQAQRRVDEYLADLRVIGAQPGPIDVGDLGRFQKPAKFARGFVRALDGEV